MWPERLGRLAAQQRAEIKEVEVAEMATRLNPRTKSQNGKISMASISLSSRQWTVRSKPFSVRKLLEMPTRAMRRKT